MYSVLCDSDRFIIDRANTKTNGADPRFFAPSSPLTLHPRVVFSFSFLLDFISRDLLRFLSLGRSFSPSLSPPFARAHTHTHTHSLALFHFSVSGLNPSVARRMELKGT